MPLLAKLYYTHYRGGGYSRPPLFLIHGAGSNHLVWPAEVRRLKETTVIAIDLPGHGKSPGTAQHRVSGYQEVLINFLAHMDLYQAVFVGHSLGAAIALQFALDHPQHVAGLICIAGAASFQIDPGFVDLFRIPPIQSKNIEQLKTYFAPRHGQTKWFPPLVKSVEGVRNSLWYADFQAASQFDLRTHLSKIKAPTLVMSGSQDPLVPVNTAEYLARKLPHGEFVRFAKHGHLLMLEDPPGVAREIQRFYSTL